LEEKKFLKSGVRPNYQVKNLVALHEIFFDRKSPVLVMECLDFSLGNDHGPSEHSPATLEQFFEMAEQLLNGLCELHSLRDRLREGDPRAEVQGAANGARARFVHRDIKPSNIGGLLNNGRVFRWKLMDFGLAKRLSEDPAAAASGKVAGTFEYMSPHALTG